MLKLRYSGGGQTPELKEHEDEAARLLRLGGEDAEEQARAVLTQFSNAHADAVVARWWRLLDELIGELTSSLSHF